MRAFWALVPPEDVTRAVEEAVAPLRARWPDLRWSVPDQRHITLAFMGALDEERVDPLVAGVADALAGTPPAEVELADHAGTPGGRRAGVIWIPTHPDTPGPELADAVRGVCADVTDVEERPWRGHLTLARIPGRVPSPGQLAAEVAAAYVGPSLGWTADRVVLLRSRTNPEGATYSELATVPLPPA